jgi:hypothetical protein
VVQNDVSFMRTVKHHFGCHGDTMRSYRFIHFNADPLQTRQTLVKLLKDVEKIELFRYSNHLLNYLIPMCKNLKEIQLGDLEYRCNGQVALTFEHSLPVKISITQSVTELDCVAIFDRFKMVKNISGLVLGKKLPVELMAKYSQVVKSLKLCNITRSLDQWCQFENLHLKHLCLAPGCIEKESIRSFFRLQGPSLESVEFMRELLDDFTFESMKMYLVNLTRVTFSFDSSQNLRLNDLKVLKKLKYLGIAVKVTDRRSQCYQLDVTELTTLTELHISGSGQLRICSRDQPMVVMVTFVVFHFRLDLEALQQLACAMPRLKFLRIDSSVRKFWVFKIILGK